MTRTKTAVLATAAILIAWGLKRHYAEARAEDLFWILSPTTWVVSAVTGAGFTWQAGEGYFSRDRLFLIEKSCAGVNFLIAAFGMLVISIYRRGGEATSPWRMLAVSLLVSYPAAVLVNAARIAIALWLADRPAAWLGMSTAGVHRIEGTIVYFAGLVLLHELVQHLDRRVITPERTPCGLRS